MKRVVMFFDQGSEVVNVIDINIRMEGGEWLSSIDLETWL